MIIKIIKSRVLQLILYLNVCLKVVISEKSVTSINKVGKNVLNQDII